MDRRTRLEMADLAARIMVESGVSWSEARAKAARRLGIGAGSARQIEEHEILGALQSHQSLFVPDQAAQVRQLREAALQAMRLLSTFNPRLRGAVAEGVVTSHTPIEIVLQADSEKDIEHLLLNAGVGYRITSSGMDVVHYRCEEMEPVVLLIANIRNQRDRSSGGTSGSKRLSSAMLDITALEQLLALTAD
jgi:hypothetical protein